MENKEIVTTSREMAQVFANALLKAIPLVGFVSPHEAYKAFRISLPTIVAPAVQNCDVGLLVEGLYFQDKFAETGVGRRGIYDPLIDKYLGPATGFTVYVENAEGRLLGQTPIGSDGKGKIKGMKEKCDTKGENGQPAKTLVVYSGEAPSVKMKLAVEDRHYGQMVFGKEARRVSLSPTSPTATPAPEQKVTPTSTAKATATPTLVPTSGAKTAGESSGIGDFFSSLGTLARSSADTVGNSLPVVLGGLVLVTLAAGVFVLERIIKRGRSRTPGAEQPGTHGAQAAEHLGQGEIVN